MAGPLAAGQHGLQPTKQQENSHPQLLYWILESNKISIIIYQTGPQR